MSEPQAVATGEISQVELGSLLFSLYSRKLTGSLVLAESEQHLHCIWLVNGLPTKVKLSEPVDLIGEILYDQEVLSEDDVDAILEHCEATGQLFGEAAQELELATEKEVRGALASQVIDRAARLFALTSGTYGFYYEDFLADYGGNDFPPVDPLPIIVEGVRTAYDLPRLDGQLASVAGSYLSLPPEAASSVGRFRFTQEEHTVAGALAQPKRLADLDHLGVDPLDVRTVVYCLGVAKALVVSPTAAAVASAPGAAPPPAPPGHVLAGTTTREQAEDLIARYGQMSFFELVGVEPGATSDEIQRGYIERARYFHPDRARGDLAELKPHLAEVFTHISVARQTLLDPASRQQYVEAEGIVDERPPPPPPPPAAPAAPVAAPASSPAAPAAPRSSSPPAAPRQSAPPAAPAPPSGPKSEARLEVEEFLDTYREMNYFELLGLDTDAEASDIQSAYMDFVRRYHPDKVPRDMADLKGQISELFTQISVAHKTLKDPKSRQEYLETLEYSRDGEGPKSETEVVQQILDAETTFQKAKVMLRTGKIDEAEELARLAVEANPDQGEYVALDAWIEARKRGPKGDVFDLIERLEEAVELAPRSEMARFYLAELYNRTGKLKKALNNYEWVLEINPHNVDALRMVRHIKRTAKDKKGKKKSTGGFLGSLFKDLGKK